MSVLLYLLDLFGGAIVSLPIVMILAFIFHKEKTKRKWVWLILYVLYMNAMLIIVGIPNFEYITLKPIINLIPFQNFKPSNIVGMILNIVMLVPFGFFLPILFERYKKFYRTLTAGIITSLLIEIIQLYTFRASDIDDLIMNTLGTVVGFFVAKMIIRRKESANKGSKEWLKLITINGVVLLVIFFIRYPMMEQIYSFIGLM